MPMLIERFGERDDELVVGGVCDVAVVAALDDDDGG